MKRNITLRLDIEVIKKGKALAAQKGISISKLLGEILRQQTDDKAVYEAAKRRALRDLVKGYHLGGPKTWSRKDLHR